MTRLLTFTLLLFVSAQLNAQSAGNILYNETSRWSAQNMQKETGGQASTPNQDHLYVSINGLFNVQADSYLAIFHAVQVGATAAQADSLMEQRIGKFIKRLEKYGLKKEDVVPDMLSLVPVYEVEVTKKFFTTNYTEIPAGFEIQKNIHVHFRDAATLDRIVTAAAINEIYDLIKVDYYVKDHEAMYDSLRKQAMKVFKKRIDQYEEAGILIDDMWRQFSDKQGVYFPLERYVTYQPVTKTSIKATKKQKRGPEEVLDERQSPTLYYNKLPYGSFDFIFNPEIVEPAVQYTYNLQIKILVERPPKKKEEEKKPEPVVKIETKHKYILVTPEGLVKELPGSN